MITYFLLSLSPGAFVFLGGCARTPCRGANRQIGRRVRGQARGQLRTGRMVAGGIVAATPLNGASIRFETPRS